jgi:DHA1 family bicyclomycin/chloramphenicol resistance-like MFS transporter
VVRDAYSPGEGARILAKASSLLSLAPILGPILGGYLQVRLWLASRLRRTCTGRPGSLDRRSKYMTESNAQPNPRADALGEPGRTYAEVFRSPAFWAYALPGALSYASIFVFISGTPIRADQGSRRGNPTLRVSVRSRRPRLSRRHADLPATAQPHRHTARVLGLGTTVGLLGGMGFLALVLADFHHWTLVVAAQFVVMTAHGINFHAPSPDRWPFSGKGRRRRRPVRLRDDGGSPDCRYRSKQKP